MAADAVSRSGAGGTSVTKVERNHKVTDHIVERSLL